MSRVPAFGATKAVAQAILRERYNTSWRFSRIKKGAWKYSAQLVLVILMYHSAARLFLHATLSERMLLMIVDAIGIALTRSFLVAPKQMFKQNHHTLPLLTGAPPVSVVTGQVLADVPVNLWDVLMISVAMSAGLAASTIWWFVPLMVAASTVVVTLMALVGNLILILWAKVVPRGLTVFFILSVVMQTVVAFLLIFLLARGKSLKPETWQAFEQIGTKAVVVFAILGVLLLGLFFSKMDWFNRWYLAGWLAHHEGVRNKGRTSASTWPFGLSGVVGSLWAKDLLLMRKNPIAKVRVIGWALVAAVIAVLFATDWLVTRLHHFHWFNEQKKVWLCVLTALVPGQLVIGEMIATLFELDRNKRNWFLIASTSPWQLLRSKVRSGLLLYVMPAIVLALVYGILAGVPIPGVLLAAGETAGLGLAVVWVTVGIASLDVRVEEIGRMVKSSDTVSEQVPQSLATICALLVAFALLLAAFLWLHLTSSAWLSDLPKLGALLLVGFVTMSVGAISLKKRMLHP